jgi:anti-anti-sigma factor
VNPIDLRALESEADFVRIELVGRLSHDGWPAGYDPLAELMGAGIYAQKVLLNLGRSSYLDSSGVSWLLDSNKRFQEAGGALVLHSATPLTAQFLKMMRMDLVLTLAPDEAAARQKVNGHEHNHSPEKPSARGRRRR